MARIVARSTQLVMVRIARREQPSATRTRPTPRSKSSVANELDVDVVNSGRSATSIFESAAVYSQFAPVVLLGEISRYRASFWRMLSSKTRPVEYCASSQQVIVVRVLNVSDA
jgi:hypothetical protein